MSYTCGAGTTILVATASQNFAGENMSMTYNGVSMTKAIGQNVAATCGVAIFYLFSPPTGSAYTLAGSGTSVLAVGATSFKGTDTTIVGASNSRADTGGVASSTLALTTTFANSWIVYAGTSSYFGGSRTLKGNTGTQRFTIAEVASTQPALMQADTTTTTVGSYNTVIVENTGNNIQPAHVALEIILPIPRGGLTLLGVG